MFVCVVSLSQPSSRVVINVFGICYMLNVCVCVVSLSQPSSRVIINVFRYLLYVKCLWVLSRYLIPVAEWSLMSLVSVIF